MKTKTSMSKSEQFKNDKMIEKITGSCGSGKSIKYWSKHYGISENDIWARMTAYFGRLSKMTWKERKRHYAGLGIPIDESDSKAKTAKRRRKANQRL